MPPDSHGDQLEVLRREKLRIPEELAGTLGSVLVPPGKIAYMSHRKLYRGQVVESVEAVRVARAATVVRLGTGLKFGVTRMGRGQTTRYPDSLFTGVGVSFLILTDIPSFNNNRIPMRPLLQHLMSSNDHRGSLASQWGVEPRVNNTNIANMDTALRAHVNNPGTQVIYGTSGSPRMSAVHFYNAPTGRVVTMNPITGDLNLLRGL